MPPVSSGVRPAHGNLQHLKHLKGHLRAAWRRVRNSHSASGRTMDTITSAASTSPRPVFEDALGKRFHAVGPGGEPLELLEVRDDLASAESFESTLRERVNELVAFQNTSYARVRGVLRLPSGSLGVVSDRVPGVRLSSLLTAAKQQMLSVEINAALCVMRQLVPAVAMMHERMPGVGHGTIAPERIVITPTGRL